MFYETYKEFKENAVKLLADNKCNDFIDLMLNSYKYVPMDEYQNNIYDILWHTAVIAKKINYYDVAIALVKKMLDMNFIVSKFLINDINKERDISELVEKNNNLLNIANSNAKSVYKIFLPENYDKNKKYPLFINFHGDGNTIETHRKIWNENLTTSKNIITVYVQSAHVFVQGSYTWSNYNTTPISLYNDLCGCISNLYKNICSECNIDNDNIILGGFSGGASAAIAISLSNIIPVKGVLAVCPYMPDNFTEINIKAVIKQGVRWSLIEGALQPQGLEAGKMHEIIKAFSTNSEYILCENLAHGIPDNFKDILEPSLKFLMQ